MSTSYYSLIKISSHFLTTFIILLIIALTSFLILDSESSCLEDYTLLLSLIMLLEDSGSTTISRSIDPSYPATTGTTKVHKHILNITY